MQSGQLRRRDFEISLLGGALACHSRCGEMWPVRATAALFNMVLEAGA